MSLPRVSSGGGMSRDAQPALPQRVSRQGRAIGPHPTGLSAATDRAAAEEYGGPVAGQGSDAAGAADAAAPSVPDVHQGTSDARVCWDNRVYHFAFTRDFICLS